MIRYTKQKTFVGIEYFDLTDPIAVRRLLEMRINAILRGQPRGQKKPMRMRLASSPRPFPEARCVPEGPHAGGFGNVYDFDLGF